MTGARSKAGVRLLVGPELGLVTSDVSDSAVRAAGIGTGQFRWTGYDVSALRAVETFMYIVRSPLVPVFLNPFRR